MRGRRGARSAGRRPASTAIVIRADRVAAARPTPAPRAQQTCRSCAPMCRQAGDESSPASSSTNRKSRKAASRPSSARCSNRGEALVPAPSPRPRPPLRQPAPTPVAQPDTGSTVSAPPSSRRATREPLFHSRRLRSVRALLPDEAGQDHRPGYG